MGADNRVTVCDQRVDGRLTSWPTVVISDRMPLTAGSRARWWFIGVGSECLGGTPNRRDNDHNASLW